MTTTECSGLPSRRSDNRSPIIAGRHSLWLTAGARRAEVLGKRVVMSVAACRPCGWMGLVLVVAILAEVPGLAQNSPPEVSNVTSAQRQDASRLVDITYDLADADGEACTVAVLASSDGGSTWAVPITAVTGDVGAGIQPASGKQIVWNPAVDIPGQSGTQ